MGETKNLMDGLFDEMNRVRDLIKEYEALPNNVGVFGAFHIKQTIAAAEKSIKDNDVVQMLVQYEELKSCN